MCNIILLSLVFLKLLEDNGKNEDDEEETEDVDDEAGMVESREIKTVFKG